MILRAAIGHFAASCGHGGFLGFPTWYKYLPGQTVNNICTPQISKLNDVWLIVAAVIEILLRIAALAAVIYTMYGGFEYITSQGDPSKTAKAKDSIVAALAGLAIAVIAALTVGFIADRVTK